MGGYHVQVIWFKPYFKGIKLHNVLPLMMTSEYLLKQPDKTELLKHNIYFLSFQHKLIYSHAVSNKQQHFYFFRIVCDQL